MAKKKAHELYLSSGLTRLPRGRHRIRLTGLIALFPMMAAAASISPHWTEAMVCMDKNLTAMLPAHEPADTLFKAARSVCAAPIDAAERDLAADLTDDELKGIERGSPGLSFVIGRKVDDLLFAYVVRFKAAGGPVGPP